MIGPDIDPLRVAMARLNAEALGVDARFEVADVCDGVPDADLIFFDPGRRGNNGKRIFDVERYQPPLSTIRGWQGAHHGQAVAGRRAGAGADVSRRRRAADIRLGRGRPEGSAVCRGGVRSARRCCRRRTRHVWDDPPAVESRISEPRGWLVEPDPAIIRAGLVANLALEIGGAQLDPEIAYITTDAKPETPWARAWRVLDWMPFNLKKLRAYLRERGVGQVTVKKRGRRSRPKP
ncbi:MAG: hypothetical protein U0521_08700 [Anaerolineae bacterium]